MKRYGEHLKQLSALAAAAVAAILLTACGTTPLKPDPAFAPTEPAVNAAPPITDGSIYRAGYNVSLFEDSRARHVGDIITIVLSENTSADKKADTTTGKKNSVDIANPTLFGKQLPSGKITFSLDQNLQSDQAFTGSGESSQSNTVTGTIAVTVAQVLANGNLEVRGEKRLMLNQGAEYIKVSGIVRPQDITSDNTVLSTQVADAHIIYGGKGAMASANSNGWLGRFFQSRFWPF